MNCDICGAMEHEPCDQCGRIVHTGEWPFCPHGRPTGTVIGDEIDVTIEHGLCNDDGTPRRFRSRSELRLACAVKGMIPYHDVYAEQGNRRLEDARHRDDWLKTGEAQRAKRDRDGAR